MRSKYFEDLEKIKELEINLSELVILAYERFELYLNNNDQKNIHEVIDLDHDVNTKASYIERYCYDLLALQQPVAKDLRFLQMSIKMASNYKRISNHLAQAGIIVLNFPLNDQEKNFVKDFIDNQKQMVLGSRDAFYNDDKDLARETMEKDEINDKLFENAIEYLVNLTKKDMIKARELSEKVLFFKYFERLGDRLERNADFAKRL
ncbi:MAG: phosphate uptake regulator PhoU [Peptoniphilaceae bacterium]|nr:phosphate uptake regulator PhoU [Peptoniphilaceae bacterium]MDY6019775.1 phosphate uptake regulator PhoU [Anaerococcus sp.]